MNLQFDDFDGDTARVQCPFCSSERKKSRLKEMTLTRKSDGAVLYYCHHCDASGSVQPHRKEYQLSAVPQPKILENALQKAHYDYLASRGISKETADKYKLFAGRKWFARLNKEADCIGFPYFRNGSLVGVKYRSFPDKDFTQETGGAHDFFGLDNITPDKPIVIVEGEIDALTLHEAGIENVVSVPGGAPVKVADGKVAASEDKKFAFVWNAREVLDKAPHVILATDQDTPGQALAEELARRIGKEKCRLAKFQAKDLNEVFNDPSREGTTLIRDILAQAQPYPIAGLSEATTYADRLHDLFSKGTGKGFSTGYQSLDTIYTVAPGQLTVVTGYPSSGKSNWVDQIMVNLARDNDWKFAVCSFENQPEIHISRLMEIYTQKRFFEGANRMSDAEKDVAFKWVTEHFLFIDSNGEEPSTLDSILERARVAVKRMGVRGLVIDPYNYIELDRTNTTETDAISQMLTRVQKFCKANDCHTWFIAHPSKIQRSGTEQPRPDGMSISGSMAWWAKADCGVTIHRQPDHVEVAVWKCRYRWVGTQGETSLIFQKTAGTYAEQLDKF
jgi:twinkle protein